MVFREGILQSRHNNNMAFAMTYSLHQQYWHFDLHVIMLMTLDITIYYTHVYIALFLRKNMELQMA